MSLPKRILLPAGHLLVDCIVLLLWLWHSNTLYRPKADSSVPQIEPVLLLQEGSIAFDPKFFDPPAEFSFVALGNVPAMLISGTARPEAHIVTRAKHWDPVWFGIHEVASSLLWLGIGVLIDSGRLRMGRLMMTYLVARFSFVPLLLLRRVAGTGWRWEMIFWLALVVYGVVVIGFKLVSKTRLGRALPRV
ncbi:MAG: hypothetical protein LAP40_05425 [Acidobacteriia bacterium]|nr:hypothetical protein [Terriglobia bacterium]